MASTGAGGFAGFSLRGLEKVEGEWPLVALAYNCKRLHKLSPMPKPPATNPYSIDDPKSDRLLVSTDSTKTPSHLIVILLEHPRNFLMCRPEE